MDVGINQTKGKIRMERKINYSSGVMVLILSQLIIYVFLGYVNLITLITGGFVLIFIDIITMSIANDALPTKQREK